jgi:hypothetical protein
MSVNDKNGTNPVMKFKRTAEAENDLLSIWRYIAGQPASGYAPYPFHR